MFNTTRERLKDKDRATKAFFFSLGLSALVFLFTIIILKFGIDSWQSRIDPLTWGEILHQLDKIVLFVSVVWIVLFFFSLHDKASFFLICPKCMEMYDSIQLTDHSCQRCQRCKSTLEKLDGFYERHPDLKRKKRKIKNKA